ncbi:MAG: MFS transporter [Myxococcota bacterium]
MSSQKHFDTAPEDRISFPHKIIYGVGGLVNNLLGAASGGMMIFLTLGLGMRVELVGILGFIPRIVDAFTDPLMGYISDHTKSRWGRRRPYIFVGAIATGIIFALLWQLPAGRSEGFYFWYFLIGSLIFFFAYTVFATPWVALGYELTPDYHERTRLMGVQNIFSQIAFIVSPWFLAAAENKNLFDDTMSGAAGLALAIGVVTVVVGVLPAIFLREPYANRLTGEAFQKPPVEEKEDKPRSQLITNIVRFFTGFAATFRFRPFVKLCVATFLVFNGFMLIASFQPFVIIYYLFDGDREAASTIVGWSGTAGGVSAFFIIAFVTWLATKIGKRRAFFVSTGISILGYGLKWFCYDPANPWLIVLPAPLMAFGLGGLFTLMGSMVADVVDLDERETGERREGMFGSIYWWVVKLGMAAALLGGGYLLGATGFDESITQQTDRTLLLMRVFDVVVPMIASGVAIWIVASYEITEQKAHEVRAELEQRRGAMQVAQ